MHMLSYVEFRALVLQHLNTLNVEEAAKHSSCNYHANGMDYLCLQRDPDGETLKLYIIEKPLNPNSGFLINPHTHRYAFFSYVLEGRVKHIRFRRRSTGNGLQHSKDWVETIYEAGANSGSTVLCRQYLRPQVIECHEKGDTYFVHEDEIHTLQMYDDGRPLLLGLVQKPDTRKNNRLFLPANEWPHMNRPSTVPCAPQMVERLRETALALLK